MKTDPLRLPLLVLVLLALAPLGAASGETRVLPGADASFRSGALGICWGILKEPPGDALQVVTRIRVMAPEANPYTSFAVQAFHPFTGAVEWVARRQPLAADNDVISPREDFKRLGGRRVLFFQAAAGPEDAPPDLVVEYLGIPDTAPEFAAPGRLEDYFAIAFERLEKM
jgi:hypothetical protein